MSNNTPPKPMLAYHTTSDKLDIGYPVLATPKVDGIRLQFQICEAPVVYARSLLPIPNEELQDRLANLGRMIWLVAPKFAGLWIEAEVQCSDFQSTTSVVMSPTTPLPDTTWVNIFDIIAQEPATAEKRAELLTELRHELMSIRYDLVRRVMVLLPQIARSAVELKALHDNWVDMGFEGTVARLDSSLNIQGRATKSHGGLTAIVDYRTKEGKIVGFLPLERNVAASKLNALGYKAKDSKAANMKTMDKLGSLILEFENGTTCKVGSGFNNVQRTHYWLRQDELAGSLVKIKFKEYTAAGIPRHPVFLGLRSPDDVSK